MELMVKWFSRKKVMLVVLFFSVALMGAAIFQLSVKNSWLKKEFTKQEEYLQQKEAFEKLNLYIKMAESQTRGYVLSGDKKFIANFDANIDSINNIERQIQNANDSVEEVKSTVKLLQLDTFIHQKIAFMKRGNALCAVNQNSAKLLIATGEGIWLADSITAISERVINNYQENLRESRTSFWQIKSSNSNFAYSVIALSLLMIFISFYFLMKQIAIIKRMSEELGLQKEQYRTALSSMDEGLITTGRDGKIIYMNPAAERITGWNNHEAINQPLKNVYNVVIEETGQSIENIVDRILMDGLPVGLENNTILKTKYSGEIIISNSGSPLFDLSGKIAGVVLVFNDITQKKIIENKLKESEEKYRNLIEQAADGIFIFDQQGNFIEANTRGCMMMGYTKEEVLKLNLMDITPEKFANRRPVNLSRINSGDTLFVERQFKLKNGNLVFAEASAKLIAGGNIQTIVRDITDRKKTELLMEGEKEVMEKIATNKPLSDILETIAVNIEKYSSGGLCSILLLDPDGVHLRHGAAPHLPEAYNLAIDGVAIGENVGSCGTAAYKKIPVTVSDIATDPLWKDFRDLALSYGLKACWSTPIISNDDNVLGTFAVYYPTPRLPKADDFNLIERAASQVRIAIEKDLAITELSKSEEKYRNLIEQASDGVIVFSLDGTIYEFNQAVYTQTGYTKEEFKKLRLLDLLFEKGLIINHANVEKIKSGQSVLIYRTIKRKDGTSLEVEINIRLLPDGRCLAFVRDITERKKAEKEIRESNERLKLIAATTNDAIWERNIETNEIWGNETHQHLYGLTLADPVPTEELWIDGLHPEDRNATVANFYDTLASDKNVWIKEYRFQTKEGSYKNIYGRTYIVRDKNRQPVRIMGSMMDITERKKTEYQIKERVKELKGLYSTSEIVNKPGSSIETILQECVNIIPPAYQYPEITCARIIFYNGKFVSENFKESVWKQEAEIIHHEKPVGKLEVFYTEQKPIEQEGPFLKEERLLINSLADIISTATERRHAEEELRKSNDRFEMIASTTHDAIWEWNLESNELWGNEMHQRLYGLTRADSVPTDEMWKQRIHPDDREVILTDLEKTLASDKSVWIAEYRFQTTDGGYKNIYDRTYIVRNENGKPTRTMGSMMDITERKKTEEDLAEREEQLRLFVEHSPAALAMFDQDMKYIVASHRWLDDYNLGNQDLTGKSHYEIFPNIPHRWKEIHRRCLAGAIEKNDEDIFDRLDGSRDWVKWEIYPWHKSSGEIGGIIMFTEVITQRKKAEDALKESEERNKALVENAPEALVMLDMESQKFVSVSESAIKLFKMTKEQLLKIGPLEVSPEYQPDGRLSSEVAMEKLSEAIDGNKPAFEWIHFDADGKLIPCEVWLVRLPSENKLLIRGSIIDITERKRAEEELRLSEQRYRSLIDQASDPIMITDQSGNFLDVNISFCNLFGYSKKEMLQLNVRNIIDPKQLEKQPMRFDRLIKGEQVFNQRNMIDKSGNIIEVEANVKMLPDGRILAIARDITERRKAEQALEESYRAIRRLTEHLQNIREEERTSIAREIHDELGQQLTVMMMDVSWLDKKISTENIAARKKVNDLLGLLDNTVKSVRRISTELRPSLLDDLGLVAAMELHLKEFGQRSGIKTVFTAPEDELQLTNQEKNNLFRIFQESLTNVARHSKAKNVKVSLEMKSEKISMQIEDDGIGFDEQKASGKETLGVLGMKERAVVMGGEYIISGKPGKGTVILVMVPLQKNVQESI